MPRRWSLDVLVSSISIKNKIFVEILMQEAGNRRFVALHAEQGHKIQEGGSLRVIAAPFGLGQIVRGTTGAEASQRRQQQQAIGSYRQGWLARHRVLATQLSLAHTQDVFLITMIHFDLPAIKAGLDQQFRRAGQIGRKEVSRLAIIRARVARELIGHRSDDQQAQASLTAAALPQHAVDFFVFHDAALAAKVNPSLGPATLRLLTYLLRSEKLLPVFSSLAGGGSKAKSRILTATRQQVNAFQDSLEHRLVGEAAISHTQQGAGATAPLIDTSPQTAQQGQCLLREIGHLAQLQILFALCFTGALAWLLERRCFLEAHRDAARRMIALLIMWEQERGLQKTQSIKQVYMERRRERIALPTRARDLLAALAQFGIVNGCHHWSLWIALQILIDNRIEQALGLPTRAREQLVIGAPIGVPAAQRTQGARQGASAKDAERSDGMFNGALATADLRERELPATFEERVKLVQQAHCCSPFSA